MKEAVKTVFNNIINDQNFLNIILTVNLVYLIVLAISLLTGDFHTVQTTTKLPQNIFLLVVVNFITMIWGLILSGYSLKYLNLGIANDSPELPQLGKNAFDYVIIALKYSLAYFVAFLILFILGIGLALIPVLGVILDVLLLIFLFTILPAMTLNYCEEFKMSDFLDFKSAIGLINENTGLYIKFMFLMFLLVLFSYVIFILFAITIIGLFLLPALGFLSSLFFMGMWAQFYKHRADWV